MILVHELMMRAGLAAEGQISDGAPCAKHHAILSSYTANASRGQSLVLKMILEDLHSLTELGATQRATDLAVVLQLFLLDHPDVAQKCTRLEAPRRNDYSFTCDAPCDCLDSK